MNSTVLKLDFETMYTEYRDAVFRFCLHRVYNREDAEDLMQKTFLAVLTALPHLERQSDLHTRAYIFVAAHNTVTDFHRHKNLITWCALDYERPTGQDFTEQVALRDQVQQAQAQLSPEHRQTLQDWQDGYHIPVGATTYLKMRRVRAKQRFKEVYEQLEREAALP